MHDITEREPGLRHCLVEAKLRTYASAEGPWRYRDRYVGFDPFTGQEIVEDILRGLASSTTGRATALSR